METRIETRIGTQIAAIVLLGAALLGGGCGGEGNGPATDCPSLSQEAWTLFERGDVASALARFNQAADANRGCADAFDGRGWSELRLHQLDAAGTDFAQALLRGAPGPDPWAGAAFALLDLDQEQPDYRGAAEAADSALARSRDFVFAHDATVDFRDMHLVLAECRYGLGDYAGANAEVDSLGGSVQDPASPTFVGDLLAEIQRLQAEIAGR